MFSVPGDESTKRPASGEAAVGRSRLSNLPPRRTKSARLNLERGIVSGVTLRQLQYLLAIAEEGNLSKAARRLHVSVAAVAEQTEKLETRLGQLLVKGRQRTTLTPLGERVLERARYVLRGVGEIERLADEPETLRVGMIETVAPYLMPGLLARRPERILPVQAQTTELLAMLEEERLEAIVLAEETVPRGRRGQLIGEEELLLAHPALEEEFADITTLTEIADHEVLLLADGHCLRDQVVDVCALGRSSLGPLEAATLDILVAMVAKGMGVTLVPEIARPVFRLNDDVTLTRIADAPRRRLVLLTTGRAEPKTAAILETLRELMSELTANKS